MVAGVLLVGFRVGVSVLLVLLVGFTGDTGSGFLKHVLVFL